MNYCRDLDRFRDYLNNFPKNISFVRYLWIEKTNTGKRKRETYGTHLKLPSPGEA